LNSPEGVSPARSRRHVLRDVDKLRPQRQSALIGARQDEQVLRQPHDARR
jgi:hypothetical protein